MLVFHNLIVFQWANINFRIGLLLNMSFSNPSSLNWIFKLVVHDQLADLVVLKNFALDGSDSVFVLIVCSFWLFILQGVRNWGWIVDWFTIFVFNFHQGRDAKTVASRTNDLCWWTQLWTQRVSTSTRISSCVSIPSVKWFRILNRYILPSWYSRWLTNRLHLRSCIILESLCIPGVRTVRSYSFWRLAINGHLLPCCPRYTSDTLSS